MCFGTSWRDLPASGLLNGRQVGDALSWRPPPQRSTGSGLAKNAANAAKSSSSNDDAALPLTKHDQLSSFSTALRRLRAVVSLLEVWVSDASSST